MRKTITIQVTRPTSSYIHEITQGGLSTHEESEVFEKDEYFHCPSCAQKTLWFAVNSGKFLAYGDYFICTNCLWNGTIEGNLRGRDETELRAKELSK